MIKITIYNLKKERVLDKEKLHQGRLPCFLEKVV